MTILVTCAIIEKDGKFLLTQRKKDVKNALRWEFPGGQVEHNEDLRKCLEREIKEELGITIKAGDIFDQSSHYYEELDMHIELAAIRCTIVSGNIEKHGIEDYAWLTPEQMKDYDITEADLPFLERL